MKKLKNILFIAFFTLGVHYFSNFTEVSASKIPTSKEYIKNYTSENYIGITNEQMIDDYEYLWKTLKENYPYFGVAERIGIDIDKIYKDYKEKIKNCKNDFEYYNLIKNFTREWKGLGHLNLLDAYELQYYITTYISVSASSQEMQKHYKPWLEALNAPLTLKNYALFYLMMNPPELLAIMDMEKNNQIDEEKQQQKSSNITTEILEEGKTAYMKINSFGYELIEQSRPVIINFYNEVKDYDNLIIDITDNSGGSYDFWKQLIVLPNVDKKLESTTYNLFMLGENNKIYIDYENRKPIKELPQFKKINLEDLKNFDAFVEETTIIEPIEPQKLFNGKIWVLVGSNVYSASENFAVFCKNTGFATLVGTNTGGDGIGSDPAFISLPNTGLLIKYSFDYGINSDGSGNEEFGTTPDIVSKEGETALETCLRGIKNGDEKDN